MGAGQLGTGVEATDVIRIRNTFYDFQFRNESHNYGETSTKYRHYTLIWKIYLMNHQRHLFHHLLSNFFASWQELSKNPNDSA